MQASLRQSYNVEPARRIADTPAQLPSPAFINRDLSLVEFFRRVLEEGLDENEPLLERLKFLTILSSNLDEFFMIRVSGLKEKGVSELGVSPDGYSRAELLRELRRRIVAMVDEQMRCYRDSIVPALAIEGIELTDHRSLTEQERRLADQYFHQSVYPLLTPQAVDPTHPFPYISGGSLNLGMRVRPKLHRRLARALENVGEEFFVRVKIPPFVERLVPVGDELSGRYILVEDLVTANIRHLVPEADPEAVFQFRITRDADVELREAEAQDLLETMEQNLRQRRFGDVVRLEVGSSMPADMTAYLIDSLEIESDDVYTIDGPLDLTGLTQLLKIDRPDLKDPALKLACPAELDGRSSAFEVIKRGDVLLHHPYMPYTIVTDFIREAVNDPDVLAIKMCLYRIGEHSPIAPLLIEAAERGKQVTVLIEIKARFDEANNIEWAKRLERAGVHVVYGLLGLKTHCKTTLIVRREGEELKRYVHIATGNYNPETSAFYTDLGILTVDEEIGADATELFNFLTVYRQPKMLNKLLVAPINLRERMIELIDREAEHARSGRPARIMAKMNRLADHEIVNALYRASQAGVEIDLIVRGICTLRPGIEGLSENIRVRSIVGRLLEHSRLYSFENGGRPEVFTGSADWMPRNLDRRVEVLTPVEDEGLKRYLREEFIGAYLWDNTKARELRPDGTYFRAAARGDSKDFNSQLYFQARSNVVDADAAAFSHKRDM